jgi:hypothetical protein
MIRANGDPHPRETGIYSVTTNNNVWRRKGEKMKKTLRDVPCPSQHGTLIAVLKIMPDDIVDKECGQPDSRGIRDLSDHLPFAAAPLIVVGEPVKA